jgi:hypothetical protein
LTISGVGFVPGAQAELVAAGGATYPAQLSSVDAFDRLTAAFNLEGLPILQTFDLRVTLPGGATDTLPGAFQNTSRFPLFETRLILPDALGRAAPATLYVEFFNNGTAAMPAQLLILQSGDPDGSDRPLLTLDPSLLARGLWTSGIPDGVGNSVQIFASGAVPGTLQPGERIRVPVYYAGLQKPFNMSDDQVEFEVLRVGVGDPRRLTGQARPSLRPAWIAEDAWGPIFANLTGPIRDWGDYVQMIRDNAAYLGQLGLQVSDVGQLYGFELQQANDHSPVAALTPSSMLRLPTPGLPLAFRAVVRQHDHRARYQTGPFGRGWTAPWQISAEALDDGTVVVHESADAQRAFNPTAGIREPTSARPGTRPSSGRSQRYELTEANGLVTRFRATASWVTSRTSTATGSPPRSPTAGSAA